MITLATNSLERQFNVPIQDVSGDVMDIRNENRGIERDRCGRTMDGLPFHGQH